MAKEPCPICGKPVKGLIKFRIADNRALCRECFGKSSVDQSRLKFLSVDAFKEHLEYRERNLNLLHSIKPTHEIRITIMPTIYLRADIENGYWYLIKKKDNSNVPVFHAREIIDYELIEDGDTVIKGGLGRAIVGGALLGDIGAIVGGTTGTRKSKTTVNTMKLRISLNNKYHTYTDIDFLPGVQNVKKNSLTYRGVVDTVSEVSSLLNLLQSRQTLGNKLDNFCSNCGESLTDGAKFCASCETPVA